MERRLGLLSQHINAAHKYASRQCLHFDKFGKRCRNESIRSHSLQRMGPLKSISENGHVIRFGQPLAMSALISKDTFEEVGVKKASIFNGFCAEHDSRIFSEIESARVEFNSRTALIFLIRAQSMEYYRKQVMRQLFNGLLSDDKLPQDRFRKEFMRLTVRGSEHAIADGEQKIKQYFSFLHKSIPSNFKFIAVRFSGKIPLAATGAFEPEFDFDRNFLFSCDPLKTKWNFIGFFSGNIGRDSLLLISGVQKYRMHRIDKFLHGLSQRKDDLPSLLITLLCAFSENVFFQNSYFSSLPEDDLDTLNKLRLSGVNEGIRNPGVFDLRIAIPRVSVSEFVART